ncbi:Energy-coupling factor transporter ATP-binding protein EcfA 1 [uncultured Ruminococcus sp.]|uniref:ABC transporter ATP-binding protein n=1 Tax=Massiliimalia timonensis TaxID=1987501 RepID=A0A8J6P692_9FIRM|nr:ATP-binding cassette domain-containing protein [Massiliimalia timonensis]MBC8611778.1 ATP-binding cassette domain-containing protein [Massiliimalia timonensis]SCH50088.1 Energy-coupling factor transporter ATP-binding protein EcfA 1 [uncultured Clostridium sp.]SCH59489.1 Energy-coupling factor transporter ATP-binding protein EcfA 1 [uncultured Ruminococcus sp.]
MNLIETRGLCYSYQGEKLALDHLDTAIPEGSITAFLGGNGAGKSTYFLNLNGVLTPDEGTVLFRGEPVDYHKKGIAALRRKVGIVFQDPNDQLFSASVLKDVSYGAYNLKLPEDEVKRRVSLAVKQTGIEEYLHAPTHALSFGQKKRVAIAGVLVMDPEVIILDEPTAGLDPSGVSEILNLMQKIKEENRVTFLIATHDIDLVPLYCDYAYVLDHGRVILSGTPKEIFAQKEILRQHHLRLPRISHLMEILSQKDHLSVSPAASTISQARRTIHEMLKEEKSKR